MHRKDIPTWVIAGGVLLTLVSGCVNSVGFLSLHKTALSHMSGMMTTLGFSAAGGQSDLLLHTVSIMVAFFVGSMLSGYILKESSLRIGRRYGGVLLIEALFLMVAALYMSRGLNVGDYMAAMACGLQNGMASSFSGAVMRTTHCTGMVTDLGIACGQALRGRQVEWLRFKLYAGLMIGFLSGAYLGAIGFSHFGTNTLYFPAGLAGATGVGYMVYKHHERVREASGGRPVGVAEFVASLAPASYQRPEDASSSNPSVMSADFLSSRVINKALDRLGLMAAEAGLIVEVALCHGRVFVVAYRQDADLAQARRQVESPARTTELLRTLAREQRLPADWVQQDLRYHLALQASRGSAVREQRPNLILSVAAPALILAVKLHAYNATPQSAGADSHELAFLLEKTGLDSLDAVEKAYACFYPAGRLDAGLRGVVSGLLPAAA